MVPGPSEQKTFFIERDHIGPKKREFYADSKNVQKYTLVTKRSKKVKIKSNFLPFFKFDLTVTFLGHLVNSRN